MIKKGFKYFWSVRDEFTKYFITGVSGFVLDMGTLILLTEVFNILPVFATILNQGLMIVYIFTLNKYWSFKNKEVPHRQFVRFLVLAGINYLIAVTLMYIFNQHLSFDYRLVRIASIVLSVSWNFFVYKYWVYAKIKPECV